MDLGINGRVALVTASTKGLGRGAADALASEGCAVAVSSRNESEAKAAAAQIADRYAVPTAGFACDVTRADDLAQLVAQTESALGTVDIAIPNTGGPPPVSSRA